MKTLACRCCLVLGMLALAGLAGASDRGTTGADFLKIGLGAGPAGMAEAVTARLGSAEGAFYNPASLMNLEQNVLTATHLNWIGDTQYEALAYARPLVGVGTLGTALYWLHMPGIKALDAAAGDLGTVQAYDLGIQFSYARDLAPWTGIPNLGLGATAKLLHRELAGLRALGAAADVGAVLAVEPGLRFGFSCQNLGYLSSFGSAEEHLPVTLRAGAGYDWQPAEQHQIEIAADAVQPLDNTLRGQVGLQYVFARMLSLRAGYQLGYAAAGFQAGAGIRYREFSLDYALKDMGVFGLTHFISAAFGFGETLGDLRKQNVGQLLRQAEELYSRSQYDEALVVAEQALVIDPNESNVLQLRDKLKTVLQLLGMPTADEQENAAPKGPDPKTLSPDQLEEQGMDMKEEQP